MGIAVLFCQDCGQAVDVNSRFCASCGSPQPMPDDSSGRGARATRVDHDSMHSGRSVFVPGAPQVHIPSPFRPAAPSRASNVARVHWISAAGVALGALVYTGTLLLPWGADGGNAWTGVAGSLFPTELAICTGLTAVAGVGAALWRFRPASWLAAALAMVMTGVTVARYSYAH